MTTSWQLLLPGIPLTSTRGALGWSSVTLVAVAGRILLVDTGSYGDRSLLLSRLRAAGISPGEVDGVFLTHFHYDHVLNFDLFPNAVFYLSEEEIRYVTGNGHRLANDPYVPALAYPLLGPQIAPFSGEVEIIPGLRTVPLPGHTPGMTGLLLEEEGVLIAGDGIKNGREFLQRLAPPTFGSQEEALESYVRAEAVARIIVPGHDSPFRVPIRQKVDYLDSYSLDLLFAGDPAADPVTIRLPFEPLGREARSGGHPSPALPHAQQPSD